MASVCARPDLLMDEINQAIASLIGLTLSSSVFELRMQRLDILFSEANLRAAGCSRVWLAQRMVNTVMNNGVREAVMERFGLLPERVKNTSNRRP